jgi:hypothetical protein
MRQQLRVVLTGGSICALMALMPFAISPAHAQNEILLNSSTVQVVHNTPANNDVLNLSLNVTSNGDSGTGSCDAEADDLLETGVHVSVSKLSCVDYSLACSCIFNLSTNSLICVANSICTTQTGFCGGFCPAFDFDAQINYVEHDIGFSSSYGTSFAPNAAGSVASKIVALATPTNTCGTWSINLQATGQNLSGITGSPVALFINDSDNDGAGGPDTGSGAACFTVNANVGNGITKPHRGAHRARH